MKILNRAIWPIDEVLTGTTAQGQIWPGTSGN